MENGFNAVKYSDYAIGHNFDSKIEFTKDNMRAILESDVAYISGHGYFGGVLPIQCQQLKRNWHLPRKKIK